LAGFGGLSVTRPGFSVAVPGTLEVAGAERGAVVAWSLERVGAGALADSEANDLEEEVPGAGLTLTVATAELLLVADG